MSPVEGVTEEGFCVGVPVDEAEVPANREELGVATEGLSLGVVCNALFFLAACFCSAMAIGDLISRCDAGFSMVSRSIVEKRTICRSMKTGF